MATNVATTPTFRWSGESRPYTLQISDTETFQNIIVQSDEVADSNVTLTDVLERNRKYYWRIGITIDSDIIYSTPRQFTTYSTDDSILLSQFTFDAADNAGKIHESIVCDIYGDSLIVGLAPSGIDVTSLIAGFVSGAADSVTIAGLKQESQWSVVDFSEPVEYSLYHNGTVARRYIVKLINSGIPVVYINTDGSAPIVSKDEYVTGRVKIIRIDGTVDLNSSTSIKGRGNSTWSMPKKPFRLKLNSKASVLGYPADKDWVLLANYSDKTLMRTSLAFALGEEFGLEYNSRTQPVELVINGEYQGSYLLGEHLKVAQDRVNIKELTANDEDDESITGGYFLEVDYRLDETVWFYSQHGIPFTVKSPENITDKQLSYLKNYIREIEAVLFSDSIDDPVNGYSKYLDAESFIKWYWINELFKNNDAIFFSSVYMYKDRNDKLKMGPLWDFDISAGNIDFNDNDDPTGWWVGRAPWLDRLSRAPAFAQQSHAFWKSHRANLEQVILQFIDEYSKKLETSKDLNFMKWPILDSIVWPNPVATGSYEGEINYLKSWLHKRVEWIDSRILPELNTFSLLSPSNESVISFDRTMQPLAFKWTSAARNARYSLELDLFQGQDSINIWSSGNLGRDTTYIINGDQLKTLMETLKIGYGDTLNLHWQVTASVDGELTILEAKANEASVISIINKRLPAPDLISPIDNQVVSPSTRNLQWQTNTTADRFIVQLSTSPDFDYGSLLLSESTADSWYRFNFNLRSLVPYYWRVMSVVENDSSAWSSTGFSVSSPYVPEIDLQGKGDTRNGAIVKWNSDASHTYIVEVSLKEDFSDTYIRVENWDGSEYDLDDLEEGATYYVRVKAVNMDVEGEWSVISVFRTNMVTSAETSFGNAISVYPNPARSHFTAQLPSGSGIDLLQLFDVHGNQVRFASCAEWDTDISFEINTLPAGIYLVVFRSKERVVAQKKIVHQ
ncbi:MAG: CotH kinase family protein [Chryseolinea sp.]